MTGIKLVVLLAGLLASGVVTSFAVLGRHSAPPPATTTIQEGAAPVDSVALLARPEIPPVQPRALAAARARAELATRRKRTRAPNP